MIGLIKKLFGTKYDKDVKSISPIVDEINSYYKEFESLSDDELKAKTPEFRERIEAEIKELKEEKNGLETKLKTEALSAAENSSINDRLGVLRKEIDDITKDTLDDILPEAFAVVKQACKRLKESQFTYEYAGQSYRWDMVPYDVQLIGGIVLHQGKIAEMATGEGKTLVAILPMYLNALPGRGAHLVTVNDYLAKRDCDWMRPVYEYLGLTVEAIQANQEPTLRKKIYGMDITYGTNNEFGFDYLRDNMVVDTENLVQREHWFSIVDEVDSVLIDEARTPLIISGPVEHTDQTFDEMNPRVKRLVEAQNRYVNSLVSEAVDLMKKGGKEDIQQAGEQLFTAHRGLPKHKRLLKLMQDPQNQKLLKETELFYHREQGRRMPEIDEKLFYTIDEKNHGIDIQEKGRDLLCNAQEDPEMFVIPDIAAELSQIEGNNELPEVEKQKLKDAANIKFADRSAVIHTISQLLRAYSLYEKDIEYVVQNNKVMIVDEFTGRILDGRRYSDGLHQAIEAKEKVKVEKDTQTLATVTLQNYFRMYSKLAGMTGTAETEATEFIKIYNLDVVVIPTNRPIVRDDRDDLIYRTKREKYNAIIEEIKKYLAEGRAILVGTASVEVSEILSKMLKRQRIPHNVLNAKQHAKEAEIVANAGKKGSITIATNMAGRGTDIKLDPDVKKKGGLVIVGSERHDARRIDRQLRGRAGRQGDPGMSQFYISLEDNLMRLFGGERIAGVMSKMNVPEGEPIQHSMITKSVERAQKKVEENNFGIRKRLLEYDDVMNQQREVIYNRRRTALRGDRLKGELFEYIEEYADALYDDFHPENDIAGLRDAVRSSLLCDPGIKDEEFESLKKQEVIDRIVSAADEFYTRKEEMTGSEFMARLERVAVLQTIDEKWREHLRVMDDLKEGIHLRAYGQKNPVLEYKGEAFKLFMGLIQDINIESVKFAFKYFPQIIERSVENPDAALPKLKRSAAARGAAQYQKSDVAPDYANQAPEAKQAEGSEAGGVKVKTVRREQPKISRNQMVTVQYGNGAVKQAKFKKVEKDIENNLCRIIDDE